MRPWLEIVAFTAIATTAVVEALHLAGLTGRFMALERAAVEALLAAWGVGTVTVSMDSFIAYTPGLGAVTIKLVPSCSSLYPMLAFIVAGLVIPGLGAGSRLSALLVYAPAIFAFNAVRVAVTAYLGVRAGPVGVHLFHDYVGTALSILAFGLLWVTWLVRSLPGSRPGVPRGAAVLAALALVALAAAPASAASPPGAGVLVLVTDEPDYYYVDAWLAASGVHASTTDPAEVLEALHGGWRGVLVLLDPNYDTPSEEEELERVASAVAGYIREGGVVVASLNGVTLLQRAGLLSDYEVTCSGSTPAPPGLAGYDPSVYCLVEGPPYASAHDVGGGVVYAARVGAGHVVVIPYNIVWAYNSTSDPVYLDILTGALVLASQLGGGGGGAAAVLGVAAAAAAAAGLAQQQGEARPRGRGQGGGGGGDAAVAVLGYRRATGEDVLGNPVRRMIVELLEEAGALYFNELWRLVGASKATIAWHLAVLEREGVIGVVHYKRYRLVYLRGRESALLWRLWRDRPGELCAIAEAVARGVALESVARRLRTQPRLIRDVAGLVESYLDVVAGWCASRR